MFCNPLLNSESNLLAYFQSSVFKYDFTYILSLYAIVGLIFGGGAMEVLYVNLGNLET